MSSCAFIAQSRNSRFGNYLSCGSAAVRCGRGSQRRSKLRLYGALFEFACRPKTKSRHRLPRGEELADAGSVWAGLFDRRGKSLQSLRKRSALRKTKNQRDVGGGERVVGGDGHDRDE